MEFGNIRSRKPWSPVKNHWLRISKIINQKLSVVAYGTSSESKIVGSDVAWIDSIAVEYCAKRWRTERPRFKPAQKHTKMFHKSNLNYNSILQIGYYWLIYLLNNMCQISKNNQLNKKFSLQLKFLKLNPQTTGIEYTQLHCI